MPGAALSESHWLEEGPLDSMNVNNLPHLFLEPMPMRAAECGNSGVRLLIGWHPLAAMPQHELEVEREPTDDMIGLIIAFEAYSSERTTRRSIERRVVVLVFTKHGDPFVEVKA